MLKNTAGQKIGAQVLSSTDGSAFTGAVTVYVCGDAGTQNIGAVGSGACTHEGLGYHTYTPSQAETNYDLVAFTFVGTGALTTTVQVYTVLVDKSGYSLTSDYDAAKTAASQASVNSIPTTPLLAANYTAPDNTGIGAIKAKTDNLPPLPAAEGSAMTLTTAYDAAKSAASQASISDLIETDADSNGLGAGYFKYPVYLGGYKCTDLDTLDYPLTTGMKFWGFLLPAGAAGQTVITPGPGLTGFVRVKGMILLGRFADAYRIIDATDTTITIDRVMNGDNVGLYLPIIPDVGLTALEKTGYSLTSVYDAAKSAASQASVDALHDFDPAADVVSHVTLVDTVTTLTNSPDVPTEVEIAGAVRTELATELGRIDENISAAKTLTAAYDPAKSAASQSSVDTISGFVDTEIAAIKAKTDNLPSDPADQSLLEAAIISATSGLATAEALATVATYVDTEVAAIKAKTDNLPALPAAKGDAMSLTSDYDAAKTAATQASVDALHDFDPAIDVVAHVTLVDTLTNAPDVPTESEVAAAVRIELATELARMDENISAAKMLIAAYDAAKTAASQASVDALHDFDPAIDVVARVTLVDTTTDVTNAVESVTAGELAGAVRVELTTELGRIDENISAAKTLTGAYDAAKTAATQSSVNAIPTTPLLAVDYVAPANADIAAIKATVEGLHDFDPVHDVVSRVTLVDTATNLTNYGDVTTVTPEEIWTYHLRTLTPGGIVPDPAPPATVETSGTNMALSPGKLNLVIYQGATFKRQLRFKDSLTGAAINLTDATVRMQIRPSVSSSTILLSLTIANGRILMTDPVNGTLMLYIADETTAALTFRKAVHDIEIEYADGTVDRVLQGSVTLSPEVTRPEVVVP